jgi:PKHD-type hydroxylase
MFREIEILGRADVEALRAIAAAAPFVDGRISNPHNVAKTPPPTSARPKSCSAR